LSDSFESKPSVPMRRTPSGLIRRDSYEILIRDTRGLRREHSSEREKWFDSLDLEWKEEVLFELEMLCKGLVCFFNPRNHPGLRRGSPLAHDFREEIRIARLGIERISAVCRILLGDRDRRFTFDRFLESQLVADHDRMRLQNEQMRQKTPEESLALLRKSFTSLGDVCDGLARLARVPYRQFVAIGHLATREISASIYFNPLLRLEFRHEYDRIRAPDILDAIHLLESDAGQRVVALSFLAMYRLLRYLASARAVLDSGQALRSVYLILAVFRSDARALGIYLKRDAPIALAEGFEREVVALRAPAIGGALKHYEDEFQVLRELRQSLDTVGNLVRIELRRAFSQVLRPPEPDLLDADLHAAASGAIAALTAVLQTAVVRLAKEFKPEVKGERVFDPYVSLKSQSDRLRKDVWMFAQILRAFIAKASSTAASTDRWAGFTSFQFVREFVSYFRQMGYPLLREGDYERFTEFLQLVAALSDSDVLEPSRLATAIAACEDFYAYLMQTFEKIGNREELSQVPFDRKDAAETLKLYLAG